MNPNSTTSPEEQDSQLGGTDQIEQLAADLALKEDKDHVTDKDRKAALEQMVKMSPAPPPVPSKG